MFVCVCENEIFPFSNETNLFPKVLRFLHSGSCQNCMSSANLVTEKSHLKLCNERALSNGEPCTSEYFTSLQSFQSDALSIHL